MAIPSTNGVFDEILQKVVTTNTSTWDDLGAGDSAGQNTIQTWDQWTSWTPAPTTPLTWASDVIDFGATTYFNLTWTFSCIGTPTFTVYTSTTGAFAGEETSTTVNVGDSDVEAFYGRYVLVYFSVAEDPAAGVPEITDFTWTATSKPFNIQQYDIVSSDLAGSSSARQIAMPRTVSKVLGMSITAHTSQYVLDDYVAADYIQDAAPGFPAIVSKTRSAPEITFVDTNGTRTDAVFDITLTVLPEQYMSNNNMAIR